MKKTHHAAQESLFRSIYFEYTRIMEITAIDHLSALSHPQRMQIFRLLMRRYPGKVTAGEMAAVLDLKPSTLSGYLASLVRAGLITQTRLGTSLLYAISMTEVRQTLDYLFLDCCRGRPDLCWPATPTPLSGAQTMSNEKFEVLFVCTGNSARSIFAEAILRKEAGDRFEVFSAGTQARSELNPFALQVLAQKGHDITVLRAKNVSEFQTQDTPRFDFVFTVCDQAANEDCPAWSGQPISAHWGLPDPVRVEGTDAQKSISFQDTYGALFNRIKAFAALPIASLDRMSLQRAVDDIGRRSAGAIA